MVRIETASGSPGQGFEGSEPGLRDIRVLSDGAARYAERPNDLPIRSPKRYAAAEWSQTAIRQLQARCRSTRFAVFPNVLAVGLEKDGRRGFPNGDVDGCEDRSVHAAEGLEMSPGIEHCDDDGKSNVSGLTLGAVDGRMGLM